MSKLNLRVNGKSLDVIENNTTDFNKHFVLVEKNI